MSDQQRLIANAWKVLEELQATIAGPYVIMGYRKTFDLERFAAEKIVTMQAFIHHTPPTFSHRTLRSVYGQFRQQVPEGHWQIVALSRQKEVVVLDTELVERLSFPCEETPC